MDNLSSSALNPQACGLEIIAWLFVVLAAFIKRIMGSK